jgi:hypothetical protein
MAILYGFGDEDSDGRFRSLRDPSLFQLPGHLKGRMHEVSNIFLRPIDAALYGPRDYVLVKLVAYTRSGHIIEALFRHSQSQRKQEVNTLERFSVLSFPELSRSQVQSAKYIDDDEMADFIVSDDQEDKRTMTPRVAARSPADSFRPSTSRQRRWHLLLDFLVATNEPSEYVSLSSSLDELTQRLGEVNTATHSELKPVRLLSELTNILHILDIEEDTQTIGKWAHSATAAFILETVAANARPPEDPAEQLMRYYHELAGTYVEPLGDHFTSRNRVNRERLVRHILGPVLSGAWMLRPRATRDAVGSPLISPFSVFEQPKLNPFPASVTEENGLPQQGFSKTDVPNEQPAVVALRQYAIFRHPSAPASLVQSTRTSTVLDHLPVSIAEDPSEYSYQETNNKLQAQHDEQAAELLDPRERKRALRSAARVQAKLEKTQRLRKQLQLERTLLPSIGSAAQRPNSLPGREIQSSQAAAPGSSQIQGQEAAPGLTMTQPERGAFGGRETAKKLKKRRAGF